MKFSFKHLAAVALGVALCVPSAEAAVGKAVVRAVRGKADVSQGNGWLVMKTGMVLRPGALIRTGVESQVDIFLDQNGPVVRVTEQTELGLDKLFFENTGADTVIETQLDLKSGRILGTVRKMAAASRYEVKTPQGVAGIKGTEYDISASGLIRIVQGQAVFAYMRNGNPATALINAGEMFVPSDGQVRPIEPSVLNELVREFGDINRPLPTELLTLLPPREPFVSAVTSSDSRGDTRHSEAYHRSTGN